ncbi:DUF3576 domain-containing protein [Candidatus Pelagibacter sp.]|nr:DUF3576 domain-containing protein [Candidatus Pelagibacter sp.]|tara:strand:- start:939 stop:1520 length:582 start_codon:yes stop_codon:yes gene_type:complete
MSFRFINIFKKIVFFAVISSFLSGCGTGFFNPDWSEPAEPDGKERARKNVREGKGIDFGVGKKQGGDFLFASSNPMWRASLETIDFMSLSTVDYAGGLIITDWYSDTQSDESVKITIKFLDNEVRVDAMEIDIHKRICRAANNCVINKVDTNLSFQIKDKILKKAALYEKQLKERKLKNRPKKVYKGDTGKNP